MRQEATRRHLRVPSRPGARRVFAAFGLFALVLAAGSGCRLGSKGDARRAGSAGAEGSPALLDASTVRFSGPDEHRLATTRKQVPLLAPSEAGPVASQAAGTGRPFDPRAAWVPDLPFPEGTVRVTHAGPAGVVDLPNQVVIAFDRPMVPLAGLDDPARTVPARLEPPIPGRWRWAGTGTAVFTPDGRFPAATEFEVSVPAGATAVDGKSLAVPVSFRFQTPRPAVEVTHPEEEFALAPLGQTVTVTLNQRVDPAVAARSVKMRTQAGAPVQVTVRRPLPRDGEEPVAEPILARQFEVVPASPLAPDTGYSVAVAAGLVGSEGPLGMDEPFEVSFSTYPELGLTGAPHGATITPTDVLELWFSTPVTEHQFYANLSIRPAAELPRPPDDDDPASASQYWSVWLYLPHRTHFDLHIGGALRDVFGQSLGETVTVSFDTGDREPFLQAASSLQVIPSYKLETVPFLYRNLDDLSIAAARLDPVAALDLVAKQEWGLWNSPADEVEGLPVDWDVAQSVPVAGTDNVNHSHALDLGPLLEGRRGGLVLVEASTTTVDPRWGQPLGTTRALFQVTDLGITFKLGIDGSAVWVTSLETGEPVPGAEVGLYRQGKALWTGRSGPDGLAEAPGALALVGKVDSWEVQEIKALARTSDDAAVAYGEWSGDFRSWSFSLAGQSKGSRFPRAFVFADRGIYRLGDKVNLKGYARTWRDGRMAGGPGAPFTWKATAPDGQEIASGEGRLDAYSAFDGSFTLPKDGSLGSYRLHFNAKVPGAAGGTEDAIGFASATVAAYRAPAFRVDVHAERASYVVGERFRAAVAARYLFGAPMSGASVRYDLTSAPAHFVPPGWDGFAFAPQSQWWSEWTYDGTTTIESRSIEVGRDGTLAVDLPIEPGRKPGPRTFTLSAEVTDVDRQTLSGEASALVHPADFYLGVKTATYLGEAGKPIAFDLAAVSPDGKPVPGRKASWKLVRRTWDSVRSKGMDGLYRWEVTPRDEEVQAGKVKIEAGRLAAKVDIRHPGYYLLRATARDDGGREVLAEADFYAFGPGEVSWARDDSNRLELVTDKPRYQVGDTARVMVKAPYSGARALVTVERGGVLDRRIITLAGTAPVVDVPLLEGHVPDAYVSVVLVRGGRDRTGPEAGRPDFRIGYAELKVDPSGKHLRVDVAPEREEYGPRDTVKVRLAVTDPGGRPHRAQVALYAVDHGVLSLTGYRTPDPFGTFYAPQGLGVMTFASAAELFDRTRYLAKGGEPGGGGGDEGPSADLRSEFRTVAAWLPGVETGEDGRAEVSFALPDNLTTFRVMAVAVDRDARFGAGEREVRVTRPVIARPALPRFLRVGDQVHAGVVVHNNTAADGVAEVKVDLAKGVKVAGAASRQVPIRRGGAVEVAFAFVEPQVGEATLRFTVVLGDARDAVEAKLPVRADLPEEVVSTFAEASPEARERVKPPPSRGAGGLEVEVGTTLLTGLDGALDYLIEYPYGCIEQTLSRTLPVALLLDLLDRAGVDRPRDELLGILDRGLAKIPGFSTGRGLAYWPGGDRADPYANAYGLFALSTMEDVIAGLPGGRSVPHEAAVEAREYLGRWLNGEEPTPWWWDRSTERAARALALLALARSGHGDPGHNSRLFKEWADLPLFAQAQLAAAILETGGPQAAGQAREALRLVSARVVVDATTAHFEEADDFEALWSTDGRTTAIATLAFMDADPAQPLVPRLVRWITQKRKGGRWSNTQENAYALLALREYAVRYEKEVPDLTAVVRLGAEELLRQSMKGRGAKPAIARADLAALHRVGEADLVVSKQGPGRLYYTATLRVPAPAEAPPRDEGFTVLRRWEVLEGMGAGGTLEPGALVRVTLTVSTPFERNFVAVVDPLPAGLEAVDRTLRTTSRRYGAYDEEGEERPWWAEVDWNHVEMHDDRVQLFADWLSPGVHTYSYLARATTPGVYDVPAPTAEEMYSPGVFGRGAGGEILVRDPRVAGK